jgi:hypothetical protein
VTNEYFPPDQFTVYRTDIPPNKQGQSHGGVLIAVYFPQDQFTVYRTDRPPNKQGQSYGGVTGLIDNQTNKIRVMVVYL